MHRIYLGYSRRVIYVNTAIHKRRLDIYFGCSFDGNLKKKEAWKKKFLNHRHKHKSIKK